MKILKTYFPLILILSIFFTACVDDDNNDGPDNGPQGGTMTGDLTVIESGAPVESTWNSSNVTCFHDTILNIFVITSTDDSGDRIGFTLVNGNAGNFQFQTFGENISVYTKNSSTDTITTQPNDFPNPPNAGGLVTITTEDFENASTLAGDIVTMSWVKIGPGDDDDEVFGFIQNASFADVPVTKGTEFSFGGDVSITCDIDGTPFDPDFTTATSLDGLIIAGTSSTGQSLTISIPDNATVGTHAFGGTSMYVASYIDGSDNYVASSGTLELDAVDIDNGTAMGTFSFTGTNLIGGATVEVTNGMFNVE